jgi:hypothetical protein
VTGIAFILASSFSSILFVALDDQRLGPFQIIIRSNGDFQIAGAKVADIGTIPREPFFQV